MRANGSVWVGGRGGECLTVAEVEAAGRGAVKPPGGDAKAREALRRGIATGCCCCGGELVPLPDDPGQPHLAPPPKRADPSVLEKLLEWWWCGAGAEAGSSRNNSPLSSASISSFSHTPPRMGTAAVFPLALPPFEAERLRGAEGVEAATALVDGGEDDGVGRDERSLTLLPGLVESAGTCLCSWSPWMRIGRVAGALPLPNEARLAWWYACLNSSLSRLTGGRFASERSEKALSEAERADEGDCADEGEWTTSLADDAGAISIG